MCLSKLRSTRGDYLGKSIKSLFETLLCEFELLRQVFSKRIIGFVKVEDLRNRLPKLGLNDRKPSRLQMGLDELLVDDVDSWRRNHAGDHVLRLAKEITIVDVAVARESHNQRRFTAA